MAYKEKYVIKIQGKLIEVSEDVYYAYFRMVKDNQPDCEKTVRCQNYMMNI